MPEALEEIYQAKADWSPRTINQSNELLNQQRILITNTLHGRCGYKNKKKKMW